MERLSKEDMKLLRNSMTTVMKRAIEDAMLTTNEVWLSSRQLSEQFSMFNEQWLKDYGHLLPRTRCEIEKDGRVIEGKWAYPRNRIQQMIMNNEIKSLKFRDK